MKDKAVKLTNYSDLTQYTELFTKAQNNIDILAIAETKLDSSFPSAQFLVNGYRFILPDLSTLKIIHNGKKKYQNQNALNMSN